MRGFALLILCGLAAPLAAAPKVAVVYSDWNNNSFQHEFDTHLRALGWPFEALENKQIKSWIGRLSEFDLVISASVGNYTNAVDMAPYADAWRAFLERGGGLWIADASYDSVLGLWMGKLGPDCGLTSAGCAPHTKAHGGSTEITCDPTHPLLAVPTELPSLLRNKGGIWAHLETCGKAWRPLVTCADGKSLVVTRDVGRGTIVVTSYFSFGSSVPQPVVTGLLENLWTRVQGQRNGVAATVFDVGPAAPGPHRATLELTNTKDQASSVEVTLRAAGDTATRTSQLPAGGRARFEVDYALKERGNQTVTAEIRSDGRLLLTLKRTLQVPPLIALALRSRHAYPDTATLPLRWTVVPDSDVPRAECRAEISIDQQVVHRVAAADLDGAVELPLAGVPVGKHQLALRLYRGERLLGTQESPLTCHPAPKVAVRRDGTTLVGGQPFFPFGFYHVSWSFNAAERLDALRAIAAGGFNAIHAGIKQLDEWDPFLDEAERLGVKVVTEFGVDMNQVVTRYRDKPAVLAWNPGDEPDGQHIDPAEMRERGERFKDLDATHPSYMTLCVPPTYHRYAHCADIIAPDPYPVPHAPLGTVYDSLSAAMREARKHGNTVWGVLQSFGYPQGPWRVPTVPEVRAMTYLALLAGVKGIIYYTYTDGKDAKTFRMWDHAALWDGMKKLPAEIKALEPALLGTAPVPLETGDKQVYAGRWTVDGTTWVIVVNADGKQPHPVALAAPAGAPKELFAEQAGPLAVKDGKLAGTLPPVSVSVWRFGP